MDANKLGEIRALTLSVRSKTDAIIAKTEQLKELNSRLELFLSALDSYSIAEPKEKDGRTCKAADTNDNIKRCRSSSARADATGNHASSSTAMPASINSLFAMNKAHRNIASQIHKLLKEQGIVGLDDVVKNIKLSKYRVIEILNIMVREKIVDKYFDKGFMYKISE